VGSPCRHLANHAFGGTSLAVGERAATGGPTMCRLHTIRLFHIRRGQYQVCTAWACIGRGSVTAMQGTAGCGYRLVFGGAPNMRTCLACTVQHRGMPTSNPWGHRPSAGGMRASTSERTVAMCNAPSVVEVQTVPCAVHQEHSVCRGTASRGHPMKSTEPAISIAHRRQKTDVPCGRAPPAQHAVLRCWSRHASTHAGKP